MNNVRLLGLSGLAAVLLPVLASGAFAHTPPPPRGVPAVAVSATPLELRLVFSQPVDPNASSIRLTRATGDLIGLKPLQSQSTDGRTLIAPVSRRLAPGSYRVEWNARPADTHDVPIQGSYTFSIWR